MAVSQLRDRKNFIRRFSGDATSALTILRFRLLRRLGGDVAKTRRDCGDSSEQDFRANDSMKV
jgi:hypothetical protein